jgi:Amt family ammonium transporter
MIVATALVLIMTPGLGFFYGGMVGKKCHQHNATKLHGYDHCNDTMGRNWFGLSFGPSIGGIIGNPLPNLFFQSVGPNTAWSLAPTIPFLLFALFH